MQLRRGPAQVNAPDARTPALRLVTTPSEPVRAPRRGRRWAWIDSYSIRVMAGILLVSIPISVVLGLGVDNWNTQTVIDHAKALAEANAVCSAVLVNEWSS